MEGRGVRVLSKLFEEAFGAGEGAHDWAKQNIPTQASARLITEADTSLVYGTIDQEGVERCWLPLAAVSEPRNFELRKR
jgi:hypothetical protein